MGRTPNALPGCWEDVKLMSHTSKMGVEQNLCKDMPLLCTCQKTIVSKTSTNTITKQFYSLTSKFKWALNNNRIEKIILIPNVVTIFFFFFFFFFFFSALLVGHCPKIQSSAISRKTNDATLTKLPTS